METNCTKEYGISVNGRPFFLCCLESSIPVLIAEARSRFGDEVKVDIVVHEQRPYEPCAPTDS